MEGINRYRPRLLVMDEGGAVGEDLKVFLLPDGHEGDGALDSLKQDLFGVGKVPQPARTTLKYRIETCGGCETAIDMQAAAARAHDAYNVVFLFLERVSAQAGIACAVRLWEIDPWTEVILCAAPDDDSLEEAAAACGVPDHLLFLRRPIELLALKQIARAIAMKWWLIQANRMKIAQYESEAQRRAVELEAAVARLEAEAALRHDREYELARMAQYDALTGLLNRRTFHELLAEILAAPGMAGAALLTLNLDRFRQVNEQHGQESGDLLLAELAARMRDRAGSATVRIGVSAPNAASGSEPVLPADQAIFRTGGDEFALLLLPAGRAEVRLFAERLRETVDEPFHIRGREIHVTCSIGVGWLTDGGDFGRILRQAESAMYKARERGNAVICQDELRGTGWMDPAALAAELEDAMRADDFEVFFSRILEEDGRLVGMAAVSRWRHPRYGLIQPETFLPIAETLGVLPELEQRQLAMACRQAGSLTAAEHRELFILFHCADVTWLDPAFPEHVSRILHESGLAADRLRLSVGTSLPTRTLSVTRALTAVAACGVGLVARNVGLGHSISPLLRDLPAGSLVQPDRSLLASAPKRPGDRLSLINLIEQLHTTGLRVLAGNIETAAQEEVVSHQGCLLQGFLYGGPVPFDQFVRDLDKTGRIPGEHAMEHAVEQWAHEGVAKPMT